MNTNLKSIFEESPKGAAGSHHGSDILEPTSPRAHKAGGSRFSATSPATPLSTTRTARHSRWVPKRAGRGYRQRPHSIYRGGLGGPKRSREDTSEGNAYNGERATLTTHGGTALASRLGRIRHTMG